MSNFGSFTLFIHFFYKKDIAALIVIVHDSFHAPKAELDGFERDPASYIV